MHADNYGVTAVMVILLKDVQLHVHTCIVICIVRRYNSHYSNNHVLIVIIVAV